MSERQIATVFGIPVVEVPDLPPVRAEFGDYATRLPVTFTCDPTTGPTLTLGDATGETGRPRVARPELDAACCDYGRKMIRWQARNPARDVDEDGWYLMVGCSRCDTLDEGPILACPMCGHRYDRSHERYAAAVAPHPRPS